MTAQLTCDQVAPARFGRLMAHATCYVAGTRLSNVSVVLPFICVQRGLGWLAALLYPAFSIGTAAGNSLSPFLLHWSRRHRHVVVAAAVSAMATLVAFDAVVTASGAGRWLTAGAFLLTACALGVGSGVTNVAFTDVASSRLTAERRGDLLLGQSAAGSVVATIVTLLAIPAIAHGDAMAKNVDLLWLGAAGLVAAGVAALFIGPVRLPSEPVRRTLPDTLRDGLRAARSHTWYRRYAGTQVVFVPVALGNTFYCLRSAHGHDKLPILVVVSSVALVVGSVLWRRVHRAFGVRGMLVGSATMSTVAAVACLAAETAGMWSSPWVLAAVFLLVTVANQAVYAASITWVGAFALSGDRAALIGLGAALVALTSCVAGAVVGEIAELFTQRWPVAVMAVLSAVAVAVAAGAPGRGQA
ncbi:MFS transporter [Mycobacterium sp. WMMD1722]|uniref:MFS transporter n=1 Tax=Mycobacterium sp. WMMD1722 TaxID=3404117 RepID=UPI003BF5A5A7